MPVRKIVIDLDNTLLRFNKTISDFNISAFWALNEHSIFTVLQLLVVFTQLKNG